MTELIEELLGRCTFPEGPVVCAVSGGADSMALLALASATKRKVTAIHVDPCFSAPEGVSTLLFGPVAESASNDRDGEAQED